MASPIFPSFTPDVATDTSLSRTSEEFNNKVTILNDQVKNALAKVQEQPSDAAALAEYQARLGDYTLFRTAQSSTVKSYKDICAAIIQNFH